MGDERAVVQRFGQRIELGRLDEGGGLPRQAVLRGPEDQEQQPGGEHRRRQGHDDDVAAEVVEPGQDRDGVAPDPHDGTNLASGADRQELAQDGRRAEVARAGLRLSQRDERDSRRPGRGDVRGAGTGLNTRQPGIATGDDRAVETAELHPQDLARTDQAREVRLEVSPVRGRRPGGRVEVGQRKRPVEHRPNGRRVSGDDRVQGSGRRVQRDHDGLRRRRDPDDPEERAEHEHEEQRPARSRPGTEHAWATSGSLIPNEPRA